MIPIPCLPSLIRIVRLWRIDLAGNERIRVQMQSHHSVIREEQTEKLYEYDNKAIIRRTQKDRCRWSAKR